ncbi:hypothetical protein HY642_03160 [Candidatus Woesearchaeota archaeon]|nr:hypothetical protein [Candidatus Woesearchaeota archaeon]
MDSNKISVFRNCFVGLGLITLGSVSGYLIGQNDGFRKGMQEKEIRTALVDEFNRRYYGHALTSEEMRNQANGSAVALEHYTGQVEAFVLGRVPEKPCYNSHYELKVLAEEGKSFRQQLEARIER